jgi:hypothetical protein
MPCPGAHFSQIELQWKTTRPTEFPTDADGTYHQAASWIAKKLPKHSYLLHVAKPAGDVANDASLVSRAQLSPGAPRGRVTVSFPDLLQVYVVVS